MEKSSKAEMYFSDFLDAMTIAVDNAHVLADEIFTGYFDKCTPEHDNHLIRLQLEQHRFLCFSNILCGVLREAADTITRYRLYLDEIEQKKSAPSNGTKRERKSGDDATSTGIP